MLLIAAGQVQHWQGQGFAEQFAHVLGRPDESHRMSSAAFWLRFERHYGDTTDADHHAVLREASYWPKRIVRLARSTGCSVCLPSVTC